MFSLNQGLAGILRKLKAVEEIRRLPRRCYIDFGKLEASIAHTLSPSCGLPLERCKVTNLVHMIGLYLVSS